MKKLVSYPYAVASAIAALIAGMAPTLLLASPAMANPYERCANGLIATGVSAEDAAAACAASLEPRDLAQCVSAIDAGTDILSTDSLESCRRVRRPTELASCVVNIDGGVAGAEPLNVLERCQRSLLPERFSDCVTGLDIETDLAADALLDTCIAADYARPVNFPADFIPRPEVIPEDL